MHSTGSICLLAGSAIVVAGCGGGTSGSGAAAAQTHTSRAGQALLTYFGQPKPMATSASGAVSVVSQAGASYTNIQMQPAANLADTYLVLSRQLSTTGGLFKYPYATAQSQLLYQNQVTDILPAISAYGNIAFGNKALTNNGFGSIRNDGTGLTTITFSNPGTGIYDPAFSTDGTNRLAFEAPTGIWIGPGTGGAATQVQSTTSLSGVYWNAAGTKLLFGAFTGTGSNSDIYTVPTTGGTPTDVTPTTLVNSGLFANPVWSPDGVTAAAIYAPGNTGPERIVVWNVTDLALYTIITPSGDEDFAPAFSPDGTKIAFFRDTTNSQTQGIYITDPLGQSTSLFAADTAAQSTSTAQGGLAWSPFLPKETVVAASGSTFYHQSASGFILSQTGNQFGSFVAFTATTPTSAAVQTPSSAGSGGQLIFTVTADAITSIGYINNYFNPGTTITLTSTPTVVVTVDGVTGQVDLVAPAAVAKPSLVKNPDGTVTYTGSFKSLYNGAGQNLAPNGATQLTVDPKTGHLVNWK